MRGMTTTIPEVSDVAPPILCQEVPASTAAVARAAFPQGNPYLRLRERLGTISSDAQFTPIFSPCGQPAERPWRLLLVTLPQFAEKLSDRPAAEAVRSRIDWKYLLGLEVTNLALDASVVREFPGRLVAGRAKKHLLDTLPPARLRSPPCPISITPAQDPFAVSICP